MVDGARPTELKALLRAESQIELERSIHCGGYDACLSEVVRQGWTSWSCARCPRAGAPRQRGAR